MPPQIRKPKSRAGKSLSDDSFDRLLEVFGSDPDTASRRYQQLRRTIVRLLERRGASFSEDLADETMFRVANSLSSDVAVRIDDPLRYFTAVAHNVYKQVLRERMHEASVLKHLPTVETQSDDDEVKAELEHLRKALEALSAQERELLTEYYGEAGGDLRSAREHLARRMNIPPNALRIRVHHARERLAREVKKVKSVESEIEPLDDDNVFLVPPDQPPRARTADFCIIWDPEILDEQEYAGLIVAVGELARSYGAQGVQRILSEGFRARMPKGVRA